MDLDQECQLLEEEKFYQEEEQKEEKHLVFKTIKKGSEISHLFEIGDRISFRHFFVLYTKSEDPKIAFIAGRKLGNSVKRNYLRRKLKRIYVENNSWFKDKQALIIAKASLLTAQDDDVRHNFKRVTKKIDEKNSK